jgi:FtsP/CotA-like multicopper oxidase with cupredoxin domain
MTTHPISRRRVLTGLARALVRPAAGAAPPVSFRPSQFDGQPLTIDSLRAGPGSALPAHAPDSVQDLILGGSMNGYGRTYDQTRALTTREGQTTRLRIRNQTMMTHPIHVHGHTFQIGAAGSTGPRKDTVLMPPMGQVTVDLHADNPGRWMVHCHNAYHAEAGMMTRLEYLS